MKLKSSADSSRMHYSADKYREKNDFNDTIPTNRQMLRVQWCNGRRDQHFNITDFVGMAKLCRYHDLVVIDLKSTPLSESLKVVY